MADQPLAAIYDEFAATYASRRDLFDLSEVIEDFTAHLPATGALLDLGCGAGEPMMSTFAARGWEVTGVDFSAGMVGLARDHLPEATVVLADMTDVDFPADSFDAIVAVYSLFHVPSHEHPQLFENCRRWLRPGGRFLFTYATAAYTGRETFNGTMEFMGHRLFYSHVTPAQMRIQCLDAGLAIVQEEERAIGGETFLWVTAEQLVPDADQGPASARSTA